jgi:hypothetical protein
LNILGAAKFISVTGIDEFECEVIKEELLDIDPPSLTLGEIQACNISVSAVRIIIPYTITNQLSEPTEVKTVTNSLGGAVTIFPTTIRIELVSPSSSTLTGAISIGYVGSSTV